MVNERLEPTLFTLEYYGYEPSGEWGDEDERSEQIKKFWNDRKRYAHWKKNKFCEMNRDGEGYRYPNIKGICCCKRR